VIAHKDQTLHAEISARIARPVLMHPAATALMRLAANVRPRVATVTARENVMKAAVTATTSQSALKPTVLKRLVPSHAQAAATNRDFSVVGRLKLHKTAI